MVDDGWSTVDPRRRIMRLMGAKNATQADLLINDYIRTTGEIRGYKIEHEDSAIVLRQTALVKYLHLGISKPGSYLLFIAFLFIKSLP